MDNQWYYARKSEARQGPVSEKEILDLIQRGALTLEDLVWKEGMSDWVAAGSMPGWFSTAGSPPPSMPVAAATATTYPNGLLGWLTFNGVMNIIFGVFGCLSCVGIPTGILMLIGGVALTGARTALERGPTVSPEWMPFLEKLRTFLIMSGVVYILTLIGFLVAAVMYVLFFGFFMAALSNAGNGFP